MVATKRIEVLPSFQLETLPEPTPGHPFPVRIARFLFATVGRLFPAAAGRLAYRFFTQPRVRAVHRSSDEVLESARLFEILYGKKILKAYEWGSGERTVMLVHSWESRGTALRSFVPGLVASGYRVVAFDGPAHGNSDGRSTNLPDFAGAVRAVINHLGRVHGIITHSFGGATTVFTLTQLQPSTEVEKLVLIGVPSNTEAVFKDALELMNVPPNARRHFKKIIAEKFGHLPFHLADVEHTLGQAKVQDVLLVHDKFDEAVAFESAERVHERFEHVNLLVTQGLGHYKLMKHPAVVQRVVDFVAAPD